ncbi:RNA-directed DNA polymerase (Reverse transcriptase), Ribonuclease H [Gossypium australe]|uniref:RNA-directed DNA polymerase (Reverse transcriptase), Ribonuclease H n=1 Tax=Gossypium australe TaxID=47621 RepID=A0A5B6VCQ1_9ROSI|nr:RNA-directed DNA polymerase (Reverse transcriptase), Ribonuclease H [Gossypium australe]
MRLRPIVTTSKEKKRMITLSTTTYCNILANEYVLNGEILYKRRKDQVLLSQEILKEVYEGVCGTHANGFTMDRQIMRFDYYQLCQEVS